MKNQIFHYRYIVDCILINNNFFLIFLTAQIILCNALMFHL